ncbi:hypothetical protein JCM13664_10400 [Methylothermus subterraneus]
MRAEPADLPEPCALERWSTLHAAALLAMSFLVAVKALPLPLLAAGAGASFLVLVWQQRGRWTPSGRFGAANWVTLLRLAGVLGLLGGSATGQGAVALALLLWLLDGIDGWLAVRLKLASAFGDLFDKETDALFTLALTALLYCAAGVPVWILIGGGLRYGFVLALRLTRRDLALPPQPLARPIGAIALLGLILGLWPPPAGYRWVLAALTAALVVSFLTSFWTICKRHHASQRTGAGPRPS